MKTGIIKTIKTNRYTQIHNSPVQTLKRLDSIGLLTYLLSLPEDWQIYKTDLKKRYGKATVTHAFEELESAGFLASFQFRNGKQFEYVYAITDIVFEKQQILEMAIGYGLPLHFVKCNFPEINDELKKAETPQTVDTPNFFEDPDLGSPKSAAQNEPPKMSDSKQSATKETKKKEVSSNISSSSIDSKIAEIDSELKGKFPQLPFAEIKDALLSDESVVINTERQYKALLTYRLSNYKPKVAKPQIKRTIKTGRTEQLPEWWADRKANRETAAEEKSSEEIEAFEEYRQQVLKKLAALRS